MNNETLKRAKRIIAKRKETAESKADANLEFLRKKIDFKENEKSIRATHLKIAIAKSEAENAAEKERLSKLYEREEQLLCSYGFTVKDITPQYFCKQCGDTGYVGEKRCKCLKEVIRKELLDDCRNVEAHHTFAASTEKDQTNIDKFAVCEKFCRNAGEGKRINLLILGKVGIGKTYLCEAVANALIEKNMSVTFVTSYGLEEYFMRCRLGDNTESMLIMESLVDADALIIDDLGTENFHKNITLEYLFQLLNERMFRGKITVVSSNLTLRQIQDKYDDRIFSRLTDNDRNLVIKLTGADKRHL